MVISYQLADVLTECSSCLMMTGAFSQNVSKLFSELKLVADNLPLCVYGSICLSENLGVGQPCGQVNKEQGD